MSNIVIRIIVTALAVNTAFLKFAYCNDRNIPNVVFIVIDDLRADRLGCYGYGRDTSPNIDKFAKEGILFTKTFSQSGLTPISIASMFTSKSPIAHNLWSTERKLANSETTLAEKLKENGYATAAFTGGGYTSHLYGFDQGFDIYKEVEGGSRAQINQLTFKWLELNKQQPFFLFLHCYTVHSPFDPPPPFNNRYTGDYNGFCKNISLTGKVLHQIRFGTLKSDSADLEHINARYDGGIRYCDKHIGELLDKLDMLGLTDNTIIILTSDHGEDFMDHGTLSHGDIYNVLIHVPLIIKYPGIIPENKRIDAIVRSIDILPTLLDILHLTPKKKIEGVSLLPLLQERKRSRQHAVFSFGHQRTDDNISLQRVSLMIDNWKLISVYRSDHSLKEGLGPHELYNIKEDPKELDNRARIENKRLKIMKKKLSAHIKKQKKLMPGTTDLLLNEQSKQALKSLGYLQ